MQGFDNTDKRRREDQEMPEKGQGEHCEEAWSSIRYNMGLQIRSGGLAVSCNF